MSAESTAQPKGMCAALDEIRLWRKESETSAARKLKELEGEERRLQEHISELQRQLRVVLDMRKEVSSQVSGIPQEEERRIRSAVEGGNKADADVLTERSALYRDALNSRGVKLQEMMADEATTKLVDEFQDFQRADAALASLPQGYRAAILAHHDQVRTKLEPLFEAMGAEPDPLQVPTRSVTLVGSVDPISGSPEALAVIVPVEYEIYANWVNRSEDLCSLLAYRVVGAISAMLNRVGASDAPMQYAPYQGHLAIQVWLGDANLSGDVQKVLEEEVGRIQQDASELRVCQLQADITWINPEIIAPSAEEDDHDNT